ncbi:MAG: hypothetical protein Q8R04_07635 [Nanoarchaeota archaeon]|nr:hypothetical protein [Nanoarchaeota archaeon]
MKTNQAKGAASDEILTKEELEELASVFDDEPFTGGQIAPRISKWVNNNTFIFLQFDKARPENATKIRYIGIGVRGTFCQSSQPNPDFTHFHRPNIANYSQGHGGKPGEAGYWLMWVAVDVFDSQGRRITPGVDELFSPTPAPDC